MSPTADDRGVFRLGCIAMGSMWAAFLLVVAINMTSSPYIPIALSILLGVGLLVIDTPLYRWVTAPEREDPLS